LLIEGGNTVSRRILGRDYFLNIFVTQIEAMARKDCMIDQKPVH